MASLRIELTASQRQKIPLNCVTITPQGPLNLKQQSLILLYKTLILKYNFNFNFIYLLLYYKFNI